LSNLKLNVRKLSLGCVPTQPALQAQDQFPPESAGKAGHHPQPPECNTALTRAFLLRLGEFLFEYAVGLFSMIAVALAEFCKSRHLDSASVLVQPEME
jgi:hypothetical protein